MNSVSPLNSSSATVIEVILSEEDVALLIGDNYDITATAYNENVKVENAAFNWSSFDLTVAVVNNSRIIALSGGQATISVICGESIEMVKVFVAIRRRVKSSLRITIRSIYIFNGAEHHV